MGCSCPADKHFECIILGFADMEHLTADVIVSEIH